ncbi:hypothetical protein GGR51DRAFT_555199 [Nemania sp. FL0031]|nr:hypothetical protein GGR51DRAFT_555199 [Nemania sp. FL0031]
MSDVHMHLQLESRLLSAPAEIRRMIYANIIPRQIHAFHAHEGPYLSICLQPNLGDDEHDGHERGTTHICSTDGRWAGRLRSTWGAHWECEELAWGEYAKGPRRRFHYHVFSLLYSCKKMYFDISVFMTERAAFNFIDPGTMHLLVPLCDKPGSSTRQLWSFWKYLRNNIRQLNVAFRFPLGFCRALEGESLADSPEIETYSAYYLWVHLWPAICQFQKLRSLCVWVDHDDPCSWSVVKERLALRYMTAAFAKHNRHSQEKNLPRIDFLVNLPKLHPAIARPITHFTESSPPLPFAIERRIRQRYHGVELADGKLEVKYKTDFPKRPHMYLFMGRFNDASITPQEMKELKRKSLEEDEKRERKIWEARADELDQLMSEGIELLL